MGGSLEGCGEGEREGGDGWWRGCVGGAGGGGETVEWEAVEGEAEAIVEEGREREGEEEEEEGGVVVESIYGRKKGRKMRSGGERKRWRRIT